MSKKIIGSVMMGALALSLITPAVPAAPLGAGREGDFVWNNKIRCRSEHNLETDKRWNFIFERKR